MLKKHLLDNINIRILRALQADGRLQNNELAEQVGLSTSACLRRVRLLEEEGVIRKYVALLDPVKTGSPIMFYVLGNFEDEDMVRRERFVFEMRLVPNILECYLMAGEYDFAVKMAVETVEDFERLKNRYFTKDTGIRTVKAEIILKAIKNTTEMPL